METSQTPPATAPYSVTVKVDRAQRLLGRKASFQSFLKVEVDGTVLGESEKILLDSTENSFLYNFTCSFHCLQDAQAIAELARKLLIVTVFDFVPEMTSRANRSVVLGQAVLDFLPLLRGETSFSCRLPLNSGSPPQTQEKPSVDVQVDVSEPLVSAEALSCSNLLKVTVETVFSVPESWTLPAGPSSTSGLCTAALELPLTAEKSQTLVFTNGILKAGGAKEVEGRPKRRPFVPQLLPENTLLPGSAVEPVPVEQEDGELTGLEDRLFRENAETRANRVSWDVEMSCFLNGEATNRFGETVSKSRLWPVEIMRPMTHSKTSPDENPAIPFHGVAFVDMGHLLFPGATRIRGAYCIHPFTETLLSDKAKCSGSALKKHVEVEVGAAAGPKSFVTKLGHQKTDTSEEHQAESALAQGNLYLEARTYIVVEISLEKPLVPRMSPEELTRRVLALIPPKPPVLESTKAAQQAVQRYHEQVVQAHRIVSDQVEQLYGEKFEITDENQEQVRAQLIGELNLSGKFFSIKEHLKPVIVQFIRDKMQQTERIVDKRQRRDFLSGLSDALVHETDVAIRKMHSEGEENTADEFHLSLSQLRHFAEEAEALGEYDLALQYHQELLVQLPNDPMVRFNMGRFYMLTGDHQKAQECYLEAFSMDQNHQSSLIMSGVLAGHFDKYADAQLFLEQAAMMEKYAVVAWMILGLLHQCQKNEILSEWAFLKANQEVLKHRSELVHKVQETEGAQPKKEQTEESQPEDAPAQAEPSKVATAEQPVLAEKQTRSTGGSVHQSFEESEKENPGSSHNEKSHETGEMDLAMSSIVFHVTVSFLLHNNAVQMAGLALDQELLSPVGGRSVSYLLHKARLQLQQGDWCSALTDLEEALSLNDEDAETWALKGHCHLLQGAPLRAVESYERSLDVKLPAADIHLVLMRLGSLYLEEGQFEQAKLLHRQVCEQFPTCLSWLGLGVAHYRLEELSLSEKALTEANHLNDRNPKVWVYLSFICLKCGTVREAEWAYRRSLEFNLQDQRLISEYEELKIRVRLSLLNH